MLLRDGRTAHLRPIRPDDRELLVDFYSRVSDESKYYRFFSPMPTLSPKEIDRFTEVDFHHRVVLIVELTDCASCQNRQIRHIHLDPRCAHNCLPPGLGC